MLIADAIGIIVGGVLCKKIPEKTVKLVSAAAFILFGFIGSYQVLTEKLNLGLVLSLAILLVIIVITVVVSLYYIKRIKVTPVACAVKMNDE
jgi:nitrate/nitrite transporter NarK